MFNMLAFWAFALTVCAFALFVHSMLMMRKLIRAQQLSAWKMLTVVLLALVSIWSLFVAFGAFATVPNFSGNAIWGDFGLYFYLQFKPSVDIATVSCQVQMAIVAIVFLIGVYLERRMFSPVQPVPQLVTLKEHHPQR